MLLFHGTQSTFSKFDNKHSNYREVKHLLSGEDGNFGRTTGTMLLNPGGFYFTDSYWNSTGYMEGSGPEGPTYNSMYKRVLMVKADVKRLRILNMDEYEFLRRKWFNAEYHCWRHFDRTIYQLQQLEGCDMVRVVGQDDYTPEGEHGDPLARYYDQYVTHNPDILRIVGEYQYHNQEVAVA